MSVWRQLSVGYMRSERDLYRWGYVPLHFRHSLAGVRSLEAPGIVPSAGVTQFCMLSKRAEGYRGA